MNRIHLALLILATCSCRPSEPQDRTSRPVHSTEGSQPEAPESPPNPDPPPRARPRSQRLRCESFRKNRPDVFFNREGKWENLTQFSRPEHVYEFDLSPDGHWVFVWHMAAPPRVLSIFDACTMKLHTRFTPGTGGEVMWTAGNTLFHGWGAGTSCECYAIYTPEGKRLAVGVTTDLEISPSRRFLLTVPASGEGDESVQVVDLKTLNHVYRSRPPDLAYVTGAFWTTDEQVQLRYMTFDSQSRAIKINVE